MDKAKILLAAAITLQHFAAGDVVNYSGNGTDANAGTFNVNTGTAVSTGDLSVEMKTFYSKALISLADANLVHDQFGVRRPIPRNGGRSIEFRKFSKLNKALTPITEGVTPAGNKLVATNITAQVDQYGDYIEQTDLLELTSIDNTIMEATKELSAQAGLTLDTVIRNELIGGTNVMYVPKRSGGSETAVTARAALDKTCLLTVKDVFRAAAELKSENAPKIDGCYVAIIHPQVAYDLMMDAKEQWLGIQKYADPENILKGEIGRLGGVRFVESTEAKIFAGENSGDPAVYATLFLGANAYGITELDGGGLEHIVKQKGYGNDPLNQRSSVGWKATCVAKRLIEEYILRVESCSSFSDSATEN